MRTFACFLTLLDISKWYHIMHTIQHAICIRIKVLIRCVWQMMMQTPDLGRWIQTVFLFQIASSLVAWRKCERKNATIAAMAAAAALLFQAWKRKSPKHKTHNQNAICNCGRLSSNIIFAPLTPKQLNEHNNCYNP